MLHFTLRGLSAAALGLAMAGVALALVAGPAGAARAARALPDSVVVRLPHRDLTLLDVQAAWYRMGPRYRPPGRGLALRRAFVEQLIEKEVLARAALAEPFVSTEPESAVYLTFRMRLLAQTLYERMLSDSLEVTAADFQSARGALADSSDTTGLAASARQAAAARRAPLVSARVRDALQPVWDDSVAALLAREFAKLPPLRQKMGDGFILRVSNQVPAFAPADTGRALVVARGDTISVGGFLLRFQGIPPTERDYPVTPGQVRARAEQFLGTAWFVREAEARGVAREPSVALALADKREGVALDHWYARHVATAVDTSDAALRASYAKNPSAYEVPAHAVLQATAFDDSATADSLVHALATGVRWTDWCRARYGEGDERESCLRVRNLFPNDPDTALVHALERLSPGGTWTRIRRYLTGPEFQIYQLAERVERRIRPFEEARTFVVRALASEQLEARLQDRLRALKRASPARWNEPALARLDFGPDADAPR